MTVDTPSDQPTGIRPRDARGQLPSQIQAKQREKVRHSLRKWTAKAKRPFYPVFSNWYFRFLSLKIFGQINLSALPKKVPYANKSGDKRAAHSPYPQMGGVKNSHPNLRPCVFNATSRPFWKLGSLAGEFQVVVRLDVLACFTSPRDYV